MTRYRLRWQTPAGLLEAREVDRPELAAHAAQLAAWYDDAHNSAMMAHTESHTTEDVLDGFDAMREEGARPFLLFFQGALAGDADLRHIAPTEAEFAIMIGARAQQGAGLGTRFTTMIHAFAFRVLNLDVVYLSIVPDNVAGRRCYEKVGYVEDGSCPARRYTEADTDVAMSLPRATFEERQAAALAEIRIETIP